jgi:Na+-driven multidrug efflux pump
MIPVGLSSATNFLTGKYIGKDKPKLAKKISNLCMFITLIWSLISMILVYSYDLAIMGFYTHDESVKETMEKAWYIVSIFVFFDCM